MSRRGRGEGTPKQLPSGLWRWHVRTDGREIAGPARATKEAARLALLQKLGNAAEAPRQSFSTFAKGWVASRKLAPLTEATYADWIKLVERDPLGKIPMGKIKPADLHAWASRLKGAAATRRNRISFVRSVCRAAGIDAAIELPKRDHRRRPLTPRERKTFAQILDTADPDTRLALLLEAYMGLRRSEAIGLRREDRDGDGMWIRRSVTYAQGTIHVREVGKSHNAYRWVAIPPELDAHLGAGKGFVLGDGKRPLHPKTVSDRIRRLLAGTDLRRVPYMGGHALRRTYGQTLLEAGVDPVTAASLMGHDPSMLMKEYSRSREDLKRAAVKRAFGSAKGHPKGHGKAI